MVISSKLLDDGETVVIGTRTHAKALVVPVLVLLVVAGLAGYLLTLPDGDRAGTWRLLIGVVALVVVLWFVVLPFLRWFSTSYVFTDRRLITRTGLLTRTGHDIQLNRISDITYEKSLLDRVLGCGTLVISDASEMGIRLHDIPRVEETQLAVSRQLYRSSRPHDDA